MPADGSMDGYTGHMIAELDSGLRLLADYEKRLRYVKQGYFYPSLSSASLARHAAAEDVVVVYCRSLCIVKMSKGEKDEEELGGQMWLREGMFIALL